MTPEQASQSYITLRQQRDAGQLPDARFRELVAQLVVTGADGTAWQLDADSGQWVVCQPPQPAPPSTKAAPANRWWSILLMMVSPGQLLAQGLGKIFVALRPHRLRRRVRAVFLSDRARPLACQLPQCQPLCAAGAARRGLWHGRHSGHWTRGMGVVEIHRR